MPERQAEKRDAAALTLTSGALCWRGNSIPSSPELKPNIVLKVQVKN